MTDDLPKPQAPLPLSGNQRRKMKSASRLYAVQALFQMEQSGQTVERVIASSRITASARSMMATRCRKATPIISATP